LGVFLLLFELVLFGSVMSIAARPRCLMILEPLLNKLSV